MVMVINGKVHEWFVDYLKERKQRVRVREKLSGVPQGSVLRPLLFILYFNEINLNADCEFINLFVDDTLLACSDTKFVVALYKMWKVLVEVDRYIKVNRLKVNVTKIKLW